MTERDEDLLCALGALVREQERTPHSRLLEQLSGRALPPETRERLTTQASRDPALQRELCAHAPLPEPWRRDTAAKAVAAARAGNSAAAADGGDGFRSDLRVPGAPSSAIGSPAPGLRRSVPWPWVAPLAVAAAVVLWLSNRSPAIDSIPEYTLQLSGAQAELRGAPQEVTDRPAIIGTATRLQLSLRPATEVHGKLDIAVFVVDDQGGARRWPAEVTRADSGALRVTLSPPPASVPTDADVRVLVGRPALLTARARKLAEGSHERGAGYQRFAFRVHFAH